MSLSPELLSLSRPRGALVTKLKPSLIRLHRPRQQVSVPPLAPSKLSRYKRALTVCASVSLGSLVTAPAFISLREAALTPRPPHGDLCLGWWVGEDADGERATLRFNKWSMCDLDESGERARGPVTFSDTEFRIGPLPLPFLRDGPPRHVAVERWPSPSSPDSMRAHGIEWQRV